MERKMFGHRSRFGSAKENVLKMFKLIRSSEQSDSVGSPFESTPENPGQTNAFNPRVYREVNKRLQEIEFQKAVVISELRHDRWKAGGPV